MDLDVERLLGAVERTVSSLDRDGQAARAVTLARGYATTVEDLWDAVTNTERIRRWFLPVSGRLEPGGRFQLEGNAGGTIMHCKPPAYLGLTWELGGDVVSWVSLRRRPPVGFVVYWRVLALRDGRAWVSIRDKWTLCVCRTRIIRGRGARFGFAAVAVAGARRASGRS